MLQDHQKRKTKNCCTQGPCSFRREALGERLKRLRYLSCLYIGLSLKFNLSNFCNDLLWIERFHLIGLPFLFTQMKKARCFANVMVS